MAVVRLRRPDPESQKVQRPPRRRAAGAAAALAAVALLAAACAPEPLPEPEPDPIRVDETLGVVRIPDGGELQIRLVVDLSGDEARAATVVAAARAALEDFGGVQGFAVSLGEPLDAACSATGGTTVATGIVAEDAVLGVVGPTCDATLAGAAPTLGEAGLVVVSPGVVTPGFTQVPLGVPGPLRVDGLLRTAPNLLWEAVGAARFAFEELGHDRAATVSDGSEASDDLAAAFTVAFEDLGGTVVAAETHPADPDTDLLPTLQAIADEDVAVGWLPVAPDRLPALSGAWAGGSRLGTTVRIAPSSSAHPDVLADGRSEGLHVTLPLLTPDEATNSVTGMASAPVRERISGLLGADPDPGWWAPAYDATVLLLRSIDDVSIVDADGSLVVSRAELRVALATAVMGGLSGRIACDDLGDCGSRAVEVRLRGVEGAADARDLPLVDLLLP
jgi:branched-chain amino acid transport system substrate-binding protein